jgi:hypothetical protein
VRQVVKTRLQQRHAAGSVSTSAQVHSRAVHQCAPSFRTNQRVLYSTYHYRVLYSTYHYPCPSHTCSVAVRRRFGICVLAVQRGGRLLPPDARRGGPRRLLQGLHTQRTARKHAVDATTTTKATRGCRPNALVTRMPAMDATYAMLPIMQLADLRHLAGLPCNMLCMRHSALNSRRLAIWVQRQAKLDICHPFRWYSACSAVRYRHAMTEHTSTAAGACRAHLRRDCSLLLGPKGTRAVHAGRTGCCSQRADRSKVAL